MIGEDDLCNTASSNNQDLELQTQALLKVGCKRIFSESVSAKDNNRTELIAMIESLRPNDIIIVYKIDRIARSLKGLIEIIELLNSKSVDLVSLDSGDKVDTTSHIGRAFFQITGVFAELERGMIRSRTKAGIEKAKLDGVKFGRAIGSTNKNTCSIPSTCGISYTKFQEVDLWKLYCMVMPRQRLESEKKYKNLWRAPKR